MWICDNVDKVDKLHELSAYIAYPLETSNKSPMVIQQEAHAYPRPAIRSLSGRNG